MTANSVSIYTSGFGVSPGVLFHVSILHQDRFEKMFFIRIMGARIHGEISSLGCFRLSLWKRLEYENSIDKVLQPQLIHWD